MKQPSNTTYTILLIFCIVQALLLGSLVGYLKGVNDTAAIYEHPVKDSINNPLDSTVDGDGAIHIKP